MKLPKHDLNRDQLETCLRFLSTGRMRTSRLRKKFFKNPLKYLKLRKLNDLYRWVYSGNIADLIPGPNPLLKLIPKSQPNFQFTPVLLTRSNN